MELEITNLCSSLLAGDWVGRQRGMTGKGNGVNEVWTDGKAAFGHVWEGTFDAKGAYLSIV
jgi:hypothetical protein